MAETKRPDDSQMPFKEVVRRTLIYQARIKRGREKRARETDKTKH